MCGKFIQRILLFSFLVFLFHRVAGQTTEVVVSKTTGVNNGISYYYSDKVKLEPGFTVAATPNTIFFCRPVTPTNQPPSLNKNFVRTETALFATSSEAEFSTFDVNDKSIVFKYFDGIGRSLQTVQVQGSPLKKDLVAIRDYDETGWETKTFLPYAAVSDVGSYKNNYLPEQSAFYSGVEKIPVDSRPFAEHALIEKSPLARVKEAYGPGNAWYTASKKITTSFTVNSVSSPVKRWQISTATGLPFSSSDYQVGTIIISQGADEDGNTTSSMKDYRGNVIQTIVHASPELITYSVYDAFGRLRFVLPPEASSNLMPDQAFLDKWAFQTQYDNKGRLIRKKDPGTDWIYYVYDRWDNLILSQDGVQRSKSPDEWTFIKYDEFNRVIMTGVYKSNDTREFLATTAENWPYRYEQRTNYNHGYSTGTFPQIIPSEDIHTIQYYDDYYFLSVTNWDAENNNFAYQIDPLFPEASLSSVKGQMTGSRIKLPGTSNTYLNSVIYYDKYYNIIQQVKEHAIGGTDRIFSGYNFPGWLLKNKRVHSSSYGSVTILEEFEYDHTGRLLKNYHTINGGTRVLLAANKYNEARQLVEYNTHSTDLGATFLQSTDYRYNIRGALTHINNSGLSNDGITNDDSNDLFGMQFVYQDETISVNGTATQPKYNGRITAVKWKTDNKKDTPKERIFGHYYSTAMNRLDQSRYAANASGSWTGEAGHYDLSNITYDKNGNIQTLDRYAEAGNTRVPLDQLTYGYSSNGNKLTNVEDAADPAFGFKNGTAGIPTEYEYDANGNLRYDLNKGIEITYNDQNLPKVIEFSDGKQLIYSYDASGYAYRKQLKQGSTVLRTVDYVQGIQYFDNSLTLIMTSAGRAVNLPAGQAGNGSDYEYEYFLKDHLNNTRVIYGYLKDTDTYKATMEMAYSPGEQDAFKNIAGTRYQNASHNHTHKNLDVPSPDRSAETNGYLNKAVGPAKMLQVSAGDKVKLEVYAKYTTSTAGSTAIVSNLLAAVTSTFGIINAGETQTAYQAMNSNLGGTLGSIVPASNTPKAYLYYILFNSDYSYNQFGYYSVPQQALLGYVPLTLNVTVPANGFLYTYVANESNINAATSVFFDDFTIIHEKTTSSLRVVESIDYDPFGVVLEGTHYVDESRPLNSYLYQGDYSEYDNQSGWHRFAARGNYDATLGRWFSVDPANQFASPYIGMGNNPVMGVDPDGRAFLPLLMALGRHMAAGAIIGGGQYLLSQGVQGKGATPKGMFQAMARGAISSGIGYGLGLGGLKIATLVNKRLGPTLLGGGVNITYQAMATTAKSVATNWIMGESNLFSKLDVGIGDFKIPIRDGKISWNLGDQASNIGTLYAYGRGFIDVLQERSSVSLDPITLGPRFTEHFTSHFGVIRETGEYTGKYSYITKWGGGDSFSQHGASFISYSSIGSESTLFHESLHAIFNRISGYGNAWIDAWVFGSGFPPFPHHKRYYESVLAPFVSEIFPKSK